MEELLDNAIVIDYRENELYDRLKHNGFNVALANLGVGDAVIGTTVIEIKRGRDFERSVFDGRLFKQMEKMLSYETPVLILEGAFFEKPASAYGALVRLIKAGVRTVWTSSPRETAFVIGRFAVANHRPARAYFGPKRGDLKTIKRRVLEAFPLIGPVLSERLLEHFGSLRRIFAASKEELEKILGKARARRFTEVLE